MTVTSEIAPGLFTLLHHDRPMRFHGSTTTWQGQPGQGTQTDRCRYSCDQCGAVLDLVLTEPC